MALNSLLIIAAGLSTGPGQDPSIDTQIVTPVSSRLSTSSLAPQSSEKITVQFRDTKPAEVLSWLEKHGVNFVISASEISDSTRVTLNVQDQPIDDVVNAIARALGGHWEKENGIRVFQKGNAMYFNSGNGLTEFAPFSKFAPMDGKAMKDGDWDKAFGKDFQKNFGPEFQKKMEARSKDFEKKFGPEFQKQMESNNKDFQKNFGPEFQKKMELFSKDLSGQFTPEMMEKLRGEGNDVHVYRFDKGGILKLQKDGKLSKEDVEKIRKQSAEARDQAAKIRIEIQKQFKDGNKFEVFGDKNDKFQFFSDKDGKVRVFGDKDGKFFDRKMFGEMKGGASVFAMPGGDKFFKDMKGFQGHTFGLPGNLDIKSFLDGLTSDQQDMQKKRGYIRYSDLTPGQKKLLGDQPDGKFEITFKVNGDQITIRND